MLLGTLLGRLRDEDNAAMAVAALNDLVLLAQVRERAAQHGETPGEYAARAVNRFTNTAADDEWLALMTAIENSADPGRTVLARMVRWSLAADAKAESAAGCGGSGCGYTGH